MAIDKRRSRDGAHARARVLLVDDHPIVREGLAGVIAQEADLVVCAAVASGPEALTAVGASQPDIAIVDVSLDGSHGIELAKELKTRHPTLPILMLSMHDEALYAERALRAGAKGYVMKREPPQKLLQAVRKVLRGGLSFSEAVTARMLERVSRSGAAEVPLPMERLSDRELQVLELIGEGRTTRQIADELHVSMKTVQAHREHLKEKLELPNAASLARFAVQWLEAEGRSRASS
jgi:DNA-binding NarL/FixJ family response regulator